MVIDKANLATQEEKGMKDVGVICKSNRQDIMFYYSRLLGLKIVLSYEGGYCGAYLYNAPVSGRVAWEDELSVWSRVWSRRAALA